MRKIVVAGTLTVLVGGFAAVVLLRERGGPTGLSGEPQERQPGSREYSSTDTSGWEATVRRTLRVGPATVAVELARTPEEWARGLSNRSLLPPDTGMLFQFPSADVRAFWMKDTLIPLDLLWIRDKLVVGVTENVQPEPGVPESNLRLYWSPGPVDQVLEVPAGWFTRKNIRVSDSAVLLERR